MRRDLEGARLDRLGEGLLLRLVGLAAVQDGDLARTDEQLSAVEPIVGDRNVPPGAGE